MAVPCGMLFTYWDEFQSGLHSDSLLTLCLAINDGKEAEQMIYTNVINVTLQTSESFSDGSLA